MIVPCANCDRNTPVASLVGAVCPDCRDMATVADLKDENERLREALREVGRCITHLYSERNHAGMACLPAALTPFSGPLSIIDRVTSAALAVAPSSPPATGGEE